MHDNVAVLEDQIRSAALLVTGAPITLERLAGVGGPGVVKISGPNGQAIVKYAVHQEFAFYQSWAPAVRQLGLGVPHVYAQGEIAGQAWILMEALPSTIRVSYRDRLPGMIAYLAQLHTIQRKILPNRKGEVPIRRVVLSQQDIDDAMSL